MPVFFMPAAIPAHLASRKRSLRASRHLRTPTPAVRVCPVAMVLPSVRALSQRNCQRSKPPSLQSSSRQDSKAKFDWLTPNPRMAPQGALLVTTAVPFTSTLGTQ